MSLGYTLKDGADLTQPLTEHEAYLRLVAVKEIWQKAQNLPTLVVESVNAQLFQTSRQCP